MLNGRYDANGKPIDSTAWEDYHKRCGKVWSAPIHEYTLELTHPRGIGHITLLTAPATASARELVQLFFGL